MTWFGGACHSVDARRRFLDVVQQWAELSHSFFAEPPAVMALDGAERERVAVATECAMDKMGHPIPWPDPQPGKGDGYIELARVRLQGLSFALFNPLKSDYQQRQGFFFLDVTDLPQLDGQLVDLKPRNKALDWVSPIHGNPDIDWIIELAHVYVDDRYFAGWPRRFAAWVKSFILPDLQFGTEPGDPGSPLSGYLATYAQTRDGLQARLRAGVGLVQLRKETLEHLFKEYVAQTRVWRGGPDADTAVLEYVDLADKRKALGLA